MASFGQSALASRALLSHSTRSSIAPHYHTLKALSSRPTCPLPLLLSRSTPKITSGTTDARPTRVAAFHASSRQSILPPPPQRIAGTVNDPTAIPPPSPTHGSYHWTFERIIAVTLVPLTVAPFAAGSLHPVLDAALAATILIHSHVGFQSVIIDYIPQKRLRRTRSAFWWGLRAATLTVAVGIYEFETNDVGLAEGIKRIWKA